jgi:hypothetical protein
MKRSYQIWLVVTVCATISLTGSGSNGAGQRAKPGPKSSATSQVCLELAASIDASEKSMSVLSAQNRNETSAPRATMRNTQIAAIMTMVNGNVAALKENRCPSLPHPVSQTAYYYSALRCQTALLVASNKSQGALLDQFMAGKVPTDQEISASADPTADARPKECNQATWTPDVAPLPL